MNTKNFPFRLGAVVTSISLLLASCGGGDEGGSPLSSPGAAPRGGGAPADLATQVGALRAETPTLAASAEYATIPGGASVDGRGNASYSMAIDVAPGPNGMQPNLSVSYSSAGRNRDLGLGFSLGGVPKLARCSHSIADDGQMEEIQFDDDDALCLNGQRLVLVEGTYGQQGSEYRTVRDPRSKIVLEAGTLADRSSEWAVYEPSGQVRRFGGASHCAVGPDDAPVSWLIRRDEDRFQNAVEYTWQVVSGSVGTSDYRLVGIEYGTASVDLNYETRTSDEMEGYASGVPYLRDQRLSQIVVNGLDGGVLHTYDLDYDAHPQTQQSILTSIQKCDAAGACLPATTFEWSDVNVNMQYTACDPVSEEAYDENGAWVGLSGEDLALIAPGPSVMLDAFGDLGHELLLWDASDDTASPQLWAQSVPGATTGIDWRLFQTALVPPTSALPSEASATEPEIYAPGWSPSATHFHGREGADVLFPHDWSESGLDPVSSQDPSLDHWGVPFATEFFILSNPLYDTTTGLVDYASTDLQDGAAGKIYASVPLDHDGDGLTDLWMCRGDGFKTGRWVLGLNDGDGTAPFSFSWTPTDIQCSVHDELLTVSLHGDARTSLLTVPAYDSPFTAADYAADYDEYMTAPLMQPIPDGSRDAYYEVSIDDNALQPTGLPRAYFQSWHDRNCRNSVADAEIGTPVYSAGMSGDRIADINGDGYPDILRAELASGDDYGNIAAIKEGLDATEFPLIFVGPGGGAGGSQYAPDGGAFLCTPDQDQDLVIRAYINTGNGFEAGQVLTTFEGLAHVNYWINWRGAVPFDHNSDGLSDFLLPGRGVLSSQPAIMSSEANGDYFVGGSPVLPDHYPGYGTLTDDDWPELFETPSRAFPTDDGQNIWFVGLDGPDAGGFCPNGSIAQRASVSGAHGRVTLASITNGLGALQEFRYGLGPAGEVSGPRPAGRIRKRDTVVRELLVQVGPGPDDTDPPMRTTMYAYADPYYDDHGRGLVGYGEVVETREESTTTRRYNFAYDAALADYPFAGRPEHVQTVSYNRMEHGVDQRVVSCEDVDDPSTPEVFDGWALVRPYQQQTWFAYAANVHNYTLTVVDDDHTSEVECADAQTLIQESTTQTAMNEWGMMTSRVFTVGNDVTTTTLSEWVIDEDEWFIAPLRSEVQSCVDGVCETRTSRRVYDPATHALQDSYREPDATDDTYLHTEFKYTPRGNVQSVRVESFGGADSRTTQSSWHPDGVVPETVTNAEGHESYVVTDPRSGVVWATVDPNGVTQKVTFDGFFRPMSNMRLDAPSGVSDGAVFFTAYAPGDEQLGSVFALQETHMGQTTRTHVGPTGKVLEVSFAGVEPYDVFPTPPQTGPIGAQIYYRNEYDALGRLSRTSHNTFVGNDPDYWTVIEYDESSRRRRAVVQDASGVELSDTERRWDVTLSAAYSGSVLPKQSFFTDEEGNQQSSITDHKGRTVVAYDALGTATCYDYGPFGRLETVQRNCGPGAVGPQPSTTYTHDVLGRLLTETDPVFGTRSNDYTAFSEVEASSDAENQVTFFTYDDLGRTVLEIAPEGHSQWVYDLDRLGALSSSTGPDGITRSYRYDGFGRLVRETTDLPALGQQAVGDEITVEYGYDVGDRVTTVEFEQGIGLTYDYDGRGYHRATLLNTPAGQEVVWGWEHSDENLSLRIDSVGASFNPTKRTRTTRQYDAATGRLEASTTNLDGSLAQAYSFGWTPAGDLEYRLDSVGGQSEEFEHDVLHRLTESESGGVVRTFAYDVLGNFTQKDGVGTYHYDTDGARLQYTDDGISTTTYGYDDNGAVTSFGSTEISWTSFGKARQIAQGAQLRRMEYDADGARVIRYAGDEITVTAHGLYERRYDNLGNLEEARFKAPNAAGAIVGEFRFNYKPSDPQPWLRTETRYVHDDHLGSAGLITDEKANEVDRVAYDAWGRARDPSDWNVYLADSATDDLPVGFTGHQAELDGGLINMRGRMYDPRLGRFMSVDPIIENPTNVQTWNAYSYVQNRPLTARDPSGLEADDGGGGSPEADIEQAAENAGNPGDKCTAGQSGDVTVQVCSDGAMPAVPLEAPAGGGPVGAAYWGAGGGSGVGMRGQNDLDVLGGIGDLATRTALRDEMNFWAAVGGQCGVQGSMLVCGFKPLGGEKSIQEAMAGAFALKGLLDDPSVWKMTGGLYGWIALAAVDAADQLILGDDAPEKEQPETVEELVEGLANGDDSVLDIFGRGNTPGINTGPGQSAARGTKTKVNKLGPDTDAAGPHTRYKRGADGRVNGYTEFDASGNPVKRFRGSGKPHGGQEPPLILEPKAGKGPGSPPKVPRTPRPDELPQGY